MPVFSALPLIRQPDAARSGCMRHRGRTKLRCDTGEPNEDACPPIDQPALRPLRPWGRGSARLRGWSSRRASWRWHADGTVPEGAEAQARLCFANCAAILAEAGMGPADVIRINAFVTAREHMAGYMAGARCLACRASTGCPHRRSSSCRVSPGPNSWSRSRSRRRRSSTPSSPDTPPGMAARDADRPFPVGHRGIHPGLRVQGVDASRPARVRAVRCAT